MLICEQPVASVDDATPTDETFVDFVSACFLQITHPANPKMCSFSKSMETVYITSLTEV